ncbi:MAG: hypothetical protein WBW73_09505, partial [Rhodoplanes sp.]
MNVTHVAAVSASPQIDLAINVSPKRAIRKLNGRSMPQRVQTTSGRSGLSSAVSTTPRRHGSHVTKSDRTASSRMLPMVKSRIGVTEQDRLSAD